MAHAVHRSAELNGQHRIELGRREIGQRRALLVSRAVHCDINLPVCLRGQLLKGLHLFVVGDIAIDSESANRRGNLVDEIYAAPGYYNRRALRCEQPGDRLTEPAVTANDNSHLTIENPHARNLGLPSSLPWQPSKVSVIVVANEPPPARLHELHLGDRSIQRVDFEHAQLSGAKRLAKGRVDHAAVTCNHNGLALISAQGLRDCLAHT